MALLLAAVFPMDPIGFSVTVSEILHLVLVGTSAFYLLAALRLGGSGHAERPWRGILVVLDAERHPDAPLGGAATPLLVSHGIEMLGLAERVTQTSYLQWLFVFAIVTLR